MAPEDGPSSVAGQPRPGSLAERLVSAWSRATVRATDVLAVARSLRRYRGSRARARAMSAFYAPLVPAGGLAFDIGSHVGDRTACFRRLGARVVAVEPQPVLARTLELLFAGDAEVCVEAVAVGARSGRVELLLNRANPTVSTASPAFVAAAADAPGWRGQRWTAARTVPLTTLDALIERHGCPDFVKIDVEGFEDEVLRGLSQAVPALSFEFTTLQPAVARAALARCEVLGEYRYNATLGESQRWALPRWVDAASIGRWLDALPFAANSGDIHARRPGTAAGERSAPGQI